MSCTIHIPNDYENYDIIENFITENHLSLNHLDHHTKSINVTGNEKDIEKLINYIEPLNDLGVVALSNKTGKFKTYINRSTKFNSLNDHKNKSTAPSYFKPTEIASIYQLGSGNSTKANIAIIELGGGYNNADLKNYWNFLKLTTYPNVVSISVDGASNSPGSDADTEVVLDIEVIGGICPNSNIYVYFAPNTDKGFYDAIYKAVYNTQYPVSVISISWGGPENSWSPTTLQAYNSLFQQAAQKGITVCVASGDNGSSDGESSGNNVDFPSSSPWVLACGGTRLTCPSRTYNNSTTSEIVWGTIQGNGASGGGQSKVFPKPTYQSNVKNYQMSGNYRCVPDVCGNADPATGWLIYLNSSYNIIGGTSAVAPLWSGYLALVGFKKFLNPILYHLYLGNPSIFHDIKVGNEGTYVATTGYDLASGLGSPNGGVLTPALKVS
ncbi:MAG: subtilase family serine protease [Satyrvirus sp.]|uniref:Subtilase family serine protease n=1 Tax=Satyrvirus sp. TaxID=2487771 RepID=A0A3G5AHQ8_9VIRU|nr:MAG: subtilase family serine protease [Satyrvirus sp.]